MKFQLYPVNLPFCFRFSMKPKSIYFSGKTPVRHQNEAGLPSSISLLDPIWIPIYFFPPYPRPCPAFSRSVSKSCLWWKNCLHCRLRFSDYDLVIISETEYTQNTPFYSDFEFRWIAGHSWFEKIIESFLRALKHLTRPHRQRVRKWETFAWLDRSHFMHSYITCYTEKMFVSRRDSGIHLLTLVDHWWRILHYQFCNCEAKNEELGKCSVNVNVQGSGIRREIMKRNLVNCSDIRVRQM